MGQFYKKIILLCVLFCASFAEGQVKFSASANPSVMNRDEYTTLEYEVKNADEIKSITLPSFKNFILVSGPNQKSGVLNINDPSSNYLSISLVFKAIKPGRFKIPAAVVNIGGRNYKSNPIELSVKNTSSGNLNSISPPLVQSLFDEPRPMNSYKDYIFRDGENVAEKVDKNMHLRLEVNKTSCYVGEPVIATYKLYTRLKSESKLTQNPSFSGFSVVDLQAPDVSATSVGKLNGREYNVYTIRKAQLYPLQDGRIDLESAELENKVQFIRESYAKNNTGNLQGIFDEFANEVVPPEAVIDQVVTLKSQPVSINVKPLPSAGKPASFKGAVGEFAIESGLDKSSFTTGKSGKLIVMISGSGNLQLLTAPEILWPTGVEAFESKTSDILSMTSVPVSGKMVFEYPFSVDKPGDYILPVVSFSYFDPVQEVYKTVHTKNIPFTVTKEAMTTAVAPAVTNNPAESTLYTKVFRERKWLVFIISFLILAGLIVYLVREKKGEEQMKNDVKTKENISLNAIIENSSLNQLNPLAASEKCLYDTECVAFYSLLMGEIKNFLSNKFSIPNDEVNKKRLSEKMDRLNISNETVLSLQKLLQDIEWQLYTPFERNEKMEEMYRRSHELLQMINTYDIKVL